MLSLDESTFRSLERNKAERKTCTAPLFLPSASILLETFSLSCPLSRTFLSLLHSCFPLKFDMALVQPNGSTDLWSKALLKLHPDDKKHVLTFQTDHKRVLQDVLKEAEAKRDAAVTKMWKITKTDGSIIVLRDVFEKVIQNVTKYAKAVDIAVNVDPLHAGVPWAIVRALLQVLL